MEQGASPLSGPSQPQVLPQSTQKIFVDHSGQPLKTFIEASSVSFRPQYIRTLKVNIISGHFSSIPRNSTVFLLQSNGGVVCHAPGEAQLLFVDPETEASKEIVSAWSSEPGKVILDVNWITKSLHHGHALLASESWGGFLVAAGSYLPEERNRGDIHQSVLIFFSRGGILIMCPKKSASYTSSDTIGCSPS